jgi:hypothetical protein
MKLAMKLKAQSSKLKGSSRFQTPVPLSLRGKFSGPRALESFGALDFELPLSLEL